MEVTVNVEREVAYCNDPFYFKTQKKKEECVTKIT